MKTKITIMALIGVMLITSTSYAYVQVRGYYRGNGTYVAPHIRTSPDAYKWNNLSSFNETPVIQGVFNPNGGELIGKIV